jgi:peptidoglycan/xylan/chitin deacetylase (PgdA/CDA1 family)
MRPFSAAATFAALVALVAAPTALPALVTMSHKEAQSNARPVPILMYHVLADPLPGAAYPELFVSPDDFSAQMRWLARRGYRAVTLDTVWRAWHGRGRLPKRPIVLSFDDGYRSDVGVALPVLKSHNWAGVLNLAWHNLGPRGLKPRGVRRLIHAGWEIDAHSLTHPDLTAVRDAQLENEVAGSRRQIRKTFHVPVEFFCYPAGRYDARVVVAVERAGFFGATSTEYGLARPSDPYSLDRIRIDGSDGLRGFASKLTALVR